MFNNNNNNNRKEITPRNHENTDLKREVRAENNKLTCKKLSAFEAFGGIPETQNRDKSTCDIVVPCLFLVICDFLIAITKTTSFLCVYYITVCLFAHKGSILIIILILYYTLVYIYE